jgi:hypothetical protein
MRDLNRNRSRSHGQALVETALVLPILIFVAVGVYAGGERISIQQTALYATRDGARFGAELGNNSYDPTNAPMGCQTNPAIDGIFQVANGGTYLSPAVPRNDDPCTVDQRIVGTMLSSLQGSQLVVKEIDIYEPDWCGQSTSPPYYPTLGCESDVYNSGWAEDIYTPAGLQGYSSGGLALHLRKQNPGSEHFLTVALTFSYSSGSPVNLFDGQYTVYSTYAFTPGN